MASSHPPRKGSTDGQHGLPVIYGKPVRVFVDGDMPRGVVAYDCEAGWCEVLMWTDDGWPVTDGENFIVRRLTGKVEVIEA